MLSVRRAKHADVVGALGVWRAANAGRGRPPSPDRIRRVREKLAEPAALTVVALDDGRVVGMALGEPGRRDDGDGPLDRSLLHISMVFVDPDRQGAGIGGMLLGELFTQARGTGCARASLWTAQDNERARRLYLRMGMRPTGRAKPLGAYGVAALFDVELGSAQSR